MIEKATFAAGCFWGVESAFRHTPGVIEAVSGYSGGQTKDPSYEEVCGGQTGHAEAVEISYDSDRLSYDQLLDIFWGIHDPTTKNRQGPDIGNQYRSIIFYHNEAQHRAALRSKARLEGSGRFHDPIVTEIIPVQSFCRAESYHQRYYEKHGRASSHI